ncbi:unnamed protein product [Linum tenue]|uniref:Uncharacterized protein n=1 Tax=Linum tenue TaxID=586396 RepID=A0AAV0ISP4_9ROSI|nr:unnamed protein product [Linum tenue]
MEATAVTEQNQQPASVAAVAASASSGGSIGRTKLRYPLRSAVKSKEEKPPTVADSTASASSRGRQASSVSKSVGVLDLSAKGKSSAKPPRRLSNPTKPVVGTPYPRHGGNIPAISETRSKRNAISQGKMETPPSDASRASVPRTFNRLSSASYWLAQIKLSESSAKHLVSLGFFKLALEAGCEVIPLQKMRDELKSYVRRFELGELEESKELFEKYNISENQVQEQQQNYSQAPEEGTRSSSDEEFHSSSSTAGTMKLRPRSLNAGAPSVKKEATKKTTTPAAATAKSRISSSLSNKTTVNSKSVSEAGAGKLQKKIQKPVKQEAAGKKGKDQVKKKPGSVAQLSSAADATDCRSEENKENMVKPNPIHLWTVVPYVLCVMQKSNSSFVLVPV